MQDDQPKSNVQRMAKIFKKVLSLREGSTLATATIIRVFAAYALLLGEKKKSAQDIVAKWNGLYLDTLHKLREDAQDRKPMYSMS